MDRRRVHLCLPTSDMARHRIPHPEYLVRSNRYNNSNIRSLHNLHAYITTIHLDPPPQIEQILLRLRSNDPHIRNRASNLVSGNHGR